MKRTLLLFTTTLLSTILLAQEADTTKAWKFNGYAGITFSQIVFYQWIPGGLNSLAFVLDANGSANYKKGKHSWDNSITAKWGMTALGYYRKNLKTKFPFKKSDDLLDITSKYGYNIAKNLDFGVLLNFKSQFSNGFQYFADSSRSDIAKYNENNKRVISHFLAPAYMTLGVGIDYKPVDYFSLYVSPLTGKMTIVQKFPNDTAINEFNYGVDSGKVVKPQMGAYIRIGFQKDIVKNVNYKTQLEVFLTYTDKDGYKAPAGLPYGGPVDIDWQNDLIFKVNKFLSATLSWRLVYDHRALVPVDKDFDYKPDAVTTRGIQIREAFGLSLSYKF